LLGAVPARNSNTFPCTESETKDCPYTRLYEKCDRSSRDQSPSHQESRQQSGNEPSRQRSERQSAPGSEKSASSTNLRISLSSWRWTSANVVVGLGTSRSSSSSGVKTEAQWLEINGNRLRISDGVTCGLNTPIATNYNGWRKYLCSFSRNGNVITINQNASEPNKQRS